MSIIFSLLLALLFLSLHACNARILEVVHIDPASKENDQKLNPGDVSIQPERKNSVPDESGEAKTDQKGFWEKNVNGEYNEPEKYFQGKGDRVIKDSSFRKTWRVPHRKRGEQEPGFNLDYLPPKTHPPVHN